MAATAYIFGREVRLAGREDLQAALDALTNANRRYLALRSGAVPPLYAAGVRYRRETRPGPPSVRERWRTIPEVIGAGTGDCEDLAAWRAAELEGARAIPVRTRLGWHIVVRHPDGALEDPSRKLGMGAREVARQFGRRGG